MTVQFVVFLVLDNNDKEEKGRFDSRLDAELFIGTLEDGVYSLERQKGSESEVIY